jgi:hypothetical protein
MSVRTKQQLLDAQGNPLYTASVRRNTRYVVNIEWNPYFSPRKVTPKNQTPHAVLLPLLETQYLFLPGGINLQTEWIPVHLTW